MRRLLPLLLCMLILIAGCRSGTVATDIYKPPPVTETSITTVDPSPADPVGVPPGTEPEIDLSLVRPNELGKVMVLMYHEIGAKEDVWARHRDNFRRDLLTLYEEGYRPINLNDFLRGRIDLPAGTTPVILTFDDGTAGQFRLIENDGRLEVDPDSAVGIMLDFREQYPDFGLAGTFYIFYPVPFRQKELVAMKLEMLVEMGFEIGNHTHGHENLARVSREEAVRALARHVAATRQYLPGYNVNTLALPYGARPKDDSYIIAGEWQGTSYRNDAILLVGANPAFSPYDRRFNPHRLPRVRADEAELGRWLEYFRKNPHERYISDGDPLTVTVPEKVAGNLVPVLPGDLSLRFYSLPAD